MQVSQMFKQLTSEIFWFFFDYFIIEYVEDYESGLSLHYPKDSVMKIYVEVGSNVNVHSYITSI